MKKCYYLHSFYLSILLVFFLSTCLYSLSATAQIERFRSKTDLSQMEDQKKEQSPNLQEIIPEDAPIPNPKDQPDLTQNLDEIDTSIPQNINENKDDRKRDQQTFGSRTQSFDTGKRKEESKYVHLNPETGYGPEVVTSFDFPDADIMEVTRHMQELTGINLILDKDVKGKVSISAPNPITVGDAWKAYVAALNMSGYTIVKSGAFYKIINSRDVRYTPTKIYTGEFAPDIENYMMKIIKLRNISASEISRNFRPFMTRYGRIIEIQQTNTIIVSDTGDNINRLVKLIDFLDIPGHEESLHILKVKHSSAQEIAKLLDEILSEGPSRGGRRSRAERSGSGPSSPGGPMGASGGGSVSKIIAEPRTNSIIAMANQQGFEQLESLVEKLDVKLVASGSDRIHVYYLNFGNSEELSKTLSDLVSSAQQQQQRGGGSGGPAGRFGGMGNLTEDAIFNNEIKVTADKANNALVVTAAPTDWLTLKEVISKLDVPRDQVYVEGMIVETTLNQGAQRGVEYFGAYGEGSAQRAVFNGGSSTLFDIMSGNVTNLTGLFGVGFGAGAEREIDFGNGNSVKVNSVNGFIKAIATNNNSNVLATPQILAMDNTEATFEMGETVPVQETVTSPAGLQTSVRQQKVAMILKLTPQINKVTRFIKLKIDQKIDDFSARQVDTQGGGVATTTRAAVTEVMVKDKDTVAMGGMMRDKVNEQESKVPLLGDIPVLGWLFKNQTKEIQKVNMLFFLTPKILSPYRETATSNTIEAVKRHKKRIHQYIGEENEPFRQDMKELADRLEEQKARAEDEKNAGHYDYRDVDYTGIVNEADEQQSE